MKIQKEIIFNQFKTLNKKLKSTKTEKEGTIHQKLKEVQQEIMKNFQEKISPENIKRKQFENLSDEQLEKIKTSMQSITSLLYPHLSDEDSSVDGGMDELDDESAEYQEFNSEENASESDLSETSTEEEYFSCRSLFSEESEISTEDTINLFEGVSSESQDEAIDHVSEASSNEVKNSEENTVEEKERETENENPDEDLEKSPGETIDYKKKLKSILSSSVVSGVGIAFIGGGGALALGAIFGALLSSPAGWVALGVIVGAALAVTGVFLLVGGLIAQASKVTEKEKKTAHEDEIQ